MSCLKCNSEWVTATGKNCASCPYCCKLARCRARKEGRWSEGCKPRECVECGKTFVPEITRQNASACSPECKKKHRKKWARKNMKEYRKGIRKCVQVHGVAMPLCVNCGINEVQSKRHHHCGRECFQESKRKGLIEWDRTGQQLGYIRKCRAQGLLMPSQSMHAEIKEAMRRTFQSIAGLYALLNNYRPCLNCGGPPKEHATEHTRFCSIKCSAEYEWECPCSSCGTVFSKRGVHGGSKALCIACKAKARRKHRKYRNIASRAKKHGVATERCVRESLLERDGWQCQLCGVSLLRKWTYHNRTLVPHPRNATLDHIIAMACGGADAPWNIQACCFSCNCKKSASNKGQLRLRL